MIHMIQCLCGPERHAIYAIMYDDKDMTPEEVRLGLEGLIEEMIKEGAINRRCEVCDKAITQFLYEDNIAKDQDWAKAKATAMRLEAEQAQARKAIQVARKAANN